MSRGIETKVAGTLLLLLFLNRDVYPQNPSGETARLMFYNVENLFDTRNDPVTDDDEFLPGGLRRWNQQRYRAKINSLFRVITAAGEWDPPSIVGFCEIENRNVLEDLVYSTNLAKYEYAILHEDSPDERGIDVGLIYRKDMVNILYSRYFIPHDSAGNPLRTRSFLYAKCIICDDTLHIFVNHWPSRRGGVLAGEEDRTRIAGMLKMKLDSIAFSDGPGVKIVLAGDFNAIPEDMTINSLMNDYGSVLSFINLSEALPRQSGTYRYMGTWEMIDQVLVSAGLLNACDGLMSGKGSLRIFSPEFLLMDDPNYPGQSPFSTYRGYRYQGGYSDHLPVILDLSVK